MQSTKDSSTEVKRATDYSKKLRQDFIAHFGIINPADEHYKFIAIMTDEMLLHAIVCHLKAAGFSVPRISKKYNIPEHKIYYICKTNPEFFPKKD
jgi:hypothetical protein